MEIFGGNRICFLLFPLPISNKGMPLSVLFLLGLQGSPLQLDMSITWREKPETVHSQEQLLTSETGSAKGRTQACACVCVCVFACLFPVTLMGKAENPS